MKPKIQFPHKEFLKDNAEVLAEHPVPEMLHKRIIGFAELEQDLEQTTDEDRIQLITNLERLSHELDEDLEEYFEEFLENNELEETDEVENSENSKQDLLLPSTGGLETMPESRSETGENTNVEIPAPSVELAEKTEVVSVNKNDTVVMDEQILETFLLAGKQQVLLTELLTKGFKTPFSGRRISVGKFQLHKRRYDPHYRILLR